MKKRVSLELSPRAICLLKLFLLSFLYGESCSSSIGYTKFHIAFSQQRDAMHPQPETTAPQPFLPLLAPSPLAPYTNFTFSSPKLSGQCVLNFTAAASLMTTTSIDCWSVFAPFLANVICCPQLKATLAILLGQSSKSTNMLALNSTTAKHCLSDIEQILVGQGATDSLKQICSVRSTTLTEASCPVKTVAEFESAVDTSSLLSACEKIDPVKECCDQFCQNAIFEAATKISSKASGLSAKVGDCKSIVVRWLASKLSPVRAKEVLRGLSNCNVNKVCPLVFPDTRHVTMGCGHNISNRTACCTAMESYVTHLQKQSFITNLQALDCATSLGTKLRVSNITSDVYTLCRISLKDFSLQVGNEEVGCLLPSMPSDATLDTSGISFLCDLNDNIPAPWPNTSHVSPSSCRKNVKIPALPAATSAQSGVDKTKAVLVTLLASSVLLMKSL